MNINARIKRATFCLGGLALALSPVVGSGADTDPLPAALTNSAAYQKARLFHLQRAYPLSYIPAGAYQRAYEQIQQITGQSTQPKKSFASSSLGPSTTPLWVSIGPAPINGGQVSPPQNVAGRIQSIAVDPSNTNHWLIGAANGGVWSTIDGGVSWTPLTDAQASLAMGDIAFAPSSPTTIYAGTGEGDLSLDSYAGAGLLKSTDGGTTWQLLATNTFANVSFSHLKVDPGNANNLVASTTVGLAGRSGDFPPNVPATGLLTSTDGGVTWTIRLKGFGTGLDIDPSNFAHQYGSLGLLFGDPANGLYRSMDSGVTWSLISGPWAQDQVGRVEVAVSPSSPSTMYVSIQDTFTFSSLGVWRTDNAWDATPTWTALPAIPNAGFQFWYDHCLSVDPTNSNVVFLGETPLWKYDGTSWSAIGGDYDSQARGKKIHPDQHALAWVGNTLLVGNDGGIWSTPDRGSTFVVRNGNLGITQFYDGSIHPSNPNFAIGGAQDNGSEMWQGGNTWQWIWFGDGCDNAISQDNPDTDWAVSSQGLTIFRTKDAGKNFTFAGNGLNGFSLFAAPFEESPNNSDTMLAGMDSLYKCTNFFSSADPSWIQNSPNFNDVVSAIAFARSDLLSQIYACGTAGGLLRITTNSGVSWADLDVANGVPGRYITGLAFHPTDPNTLYVSLSGFDEGTPGQPGHLFVTTNALSASPSWVNVTPPVNIPINRVVVDPNIPSTLYVGTDIAVWKSIDSGSSWSFMGPSTGFPNTAVFDLQINRTTSRLVAFTHGRSAFMLNLAAGNGTTADVFASLRANPNPLIVGGNLTYTLTVGNNGLAAATNVVATQVLPNNAAYLSASTSQGTVSQAGGIVTATIGDLNPGAIATITVVVNPPAPETCVSSASAHSDTPDPDTSNNSATISSVVLPRSADLALGLTASPPSGLVGQPLTYSLSVTNFGPSTASNVVATTTLPVSASIISLSSSQGSNFVSGNTVTCYFRNLAVGARVSATIQVQPTVAGTITASSTVSATEVDPLPGNNSASVDTSIGAAADLALGLSPSSLSVVRGSNLVYTISVTNFGPSTANNVSVSDSLPPNVTLISSNASKGTISVSSGTLSASLGTLTNGEIASVVFTVGTAGVPTNSFIVDSATISATETDVISTNNSASVSVLVAAPFVAFSIANVQLTAESFSPANGVIDPGEDVTVNFFLQNTGNVPNIGSGLNVTLLATNGVSSPSGSINYGVIAPGSVQNGPFSFTGNGTNGGTIVANLLLQYGTSNQILTYTFLLPRIIAFANTNRIDIPRTTQDQLQPGPAAPYPSTISVSGVTGVLGRVTVTLSNLTHTFPHDINLLLVGPTGRKTLLMSDAADGPGVSQADVTFDDFAPAPIPNSGQLVAGTYQPSAYDPSAFFTNPAPAGPYGTTLSSYLTLDPNGVWSLYAYDDSQGDFGNVAGGWSLAFTTETPVNQIANLSASAVSSPASVLVGGIVTNVFTVTNGGPAAARVVWVTNTLSSSVILQSAVNSVGAAFATNGNQLSANLGIIPSGASRTVTLVVSNTAAGTITNSILAVDASGELDISALDNSADAVFVAQLPTADLVVSNYASATTVTVGANTTITIGVTNLGPQNALSVLVSNQIPAGFTLVSSNSSAGATNITVSGGVCFALLPTLQPGSNGWVTLVLKGTAQGLYTNVSSAFTGSTDPVSSNNTARIALQVNPPAPLILPAGALLVYESNQPANGTIDAGEMVTLALYLTNAGTANSTNLTATLLANDGVLNPSASRNYGTLTVGGASVSNYFSFKAGAPASGQIQVVLQLTDAGGYAANVTNTFYLPGVIASSNTALISIPDHGPAAPFPSVIPISGVTGVVQKVTVSLTGLTHTFPHDLDVLLVAPSGQKIMLMGQCGGGHSVSGVNLTFDDFAAGGLSDTAQIVSGTYKPSDFDPSGALPAPAPAGPVLTRLSSLNGIAPNGNWSLYVFDGSAGDSGSISGGWTVAITVINPVNPVVNLLLGMSANPASLLVGRTLTYTMSLTNLGPATATNVNVRDTLPAGLTLVSSNTTAGTIMKVGSTVILTNISLAPAAGLSATIVVTPSTAGTYINGATAGAAQPDLDPASNTAQTSVTAVNAGPASINLARLTSQQIQITITGDPGQGYQVQSSSNLANWLPVLTGTTAPSGTLRFSTNITTRAQFYRSIRLP